MAEFSCCSGFFDSVVALIVNTSTDLPPDVRAAMRHAVGTEEASSRAGQALNIIGQNIDQAADWSNGHEVEHAVIFGMSSIWEGDTCHVVYSTESGQVGYKHSDPDDDAILEQSEWISAYNLVSGQNGQYLAVDIDISDWTTYPVCP